MSKPKPLEEWHEREMKNTPLNEITHHDDYVAEPHPNRHVDQETTHLWIYVTCYYCHYYWERDNDKEPGMISRVIDKIWDRGIRWAQERQVKKVLKYKTKSFDD